MDSFCLVIRLWFFISIAGFVSCTSKPTDYRDNVPQLNGKATQAPHPQYDNLEGYFADEEEDGLDNSSFSILTGQANDQHDLQSHVSGECAHYKALAGLSLNVPSGCQFRTGNVNQELEDCAGIDSSSDKYLLLGLDASFKSSVHQNATVRIRDGEIFSLIPMCVDMSNDVAQITIFDPKQFEYKIETTSTSKSTVVKHGQFDGYFVGSFDGYDANGNLQACDLDADNKVVCPTQVTLMDPQQGVNLKSSKIPSVNVQVLPQGFNPMMPELKMPAPFVTDHQQELIRGAIHHAGLVNPTNGELSFADIDLEYSASDSIFNLGVSRSYRSLFAHYSDFGRHWGALTERQRHYTMLTPFGTDGTYTFIETPGARHFMLPRPDSPSPFLMNEEYNSIRPDVSASRFLYPWPGGPDHPGNWNNYDFNGLLVSQLDPYTQNRVFNLYSGTQLLLKIDQILARGPVEGDAAAACSTRQGCLQFVVNTAQQASLLLGFGDEPQNVEQAIMLLRETMKVPGNFVYFHRNLRGNVLAVVDKTGSFTWYRYGNEEEGKADLLTQVRRYALQEPVVLQGAQPAVQYAVLYNYDYVEASSVEQDHWRGLLTARITPQSPDAITNIEYAVHSGLVGNAPLVREFSIAGIEHIADYTFTADGGVTSIEDGLGRAFSYSFDDIGFVHEMRGPTESSDNEVLLERLMDRRLLRVVNSISRGVESLRLYDQDGDLEQIVQCADREENGTRIVAELASWGNGVANNLKCEADNSDLKRVVSVNQVTHYPAFIDLQTSPILLEMDLPELSSDRLYAGEAGQTQRRSRVIEGGCFGPVGITRFISQESGSSCELEPAELSEGGESLFGNWIQPYSYSTFEDGTLMQSTKLNSNTEPALRPTQSQTSLSGLINSLPLNVRPYVGHQAGFINQLPTMGLTTVSGVSLGGQRLEVELPFSEGEANWALYDPYGNIVFERTAEGVEREYVYDYRSPSAILVDVTEINGSLISLNPGETELVNQLKQAKDEAGRSHNTLARIINNRFLNNGSFINQKLIDIQMEPNNFFVTHAFNGLSPISEMSYYANGLVDTAKHPTRTSIAGGWRWDASDNQYDQFRRLRETRTPENAIQRIQYRDNYDRGVQWTETDMTHPSLGGQQYRTEVIAWDHAGRPLEVLECTGNIGGQVTGPKSTKTSYGYSPFGEVVQMTAESFSGDCSNRAGGNLLITSLTSYNLDLQTGVVLSSASSVTTPENGGTSDLVEPSNVENLKFDRYLRVRESIELTDNIKTQIDGVMDKNPSVQVLAPEEYRAGTPSVLVQQSSQTFDGCGNAVMTTNGAETIITEVNYSHHRRACLPVATIEKGGWKTKHIFDKNYNIIGIDDRENEDRVGHETALHLSLAYFDTNEEVSKVFEISGGPGGTTAGGFLDSSETLIVHEASFSTINHRGTVLKRQDFFGGQDLIRNSYQREESIYKTVEGLPMDGSQDSIDQDGGSGSALTNYITVLESSANSKTVSRKTAANQPDQFLEVKAVHPIFGQGGSSSILRKTPNPNDPESNTETLVQQTILDNVGRITEYRKGIDQLEPLITTEYENFQFSKPTSITSVKELANGTVDLRITEHLDVEGDLVKHSRSLRQNMGVTDVGEREIDYSGAGIPTYVKYSQEAGHADQVPNGRVNMTTERFQTYDSANRISIEQVKLKDSLSANAEDFQLHAATGQQLSRDRFSEAGESLQVNYTYTDDGYRMNYDGLSVEYEFASGNSHNAGKLIQISIQTPDGEYHTYNLNSNNTLYGGFIDHDANTMNIGDGISFWEEWALYQFLFGDPTVTITQRNESRFNFEMNEIASFLGDNPISGLKKREDNYFGNVDLVFEQNLSRPKFIKHQDTRYGNDQFTELFDIGAAKKQVQYERDNLLEEINRTKHRSCDQLFMGATGPIHETSFLESINDGDRLTFFDEQGRLAFSRRAHYKRSSFRAPVEQSWLVDVYNSYDDFGERNAYEEVVRYENHRPQDAGITPFANETVLRAISSRRFNVTNVLGLVGGGSKSITLKEVIVDSGRHELLSDPSTPAIDRENALSDTSEGVWYPIMGPLNGPIMAFRKENPDGTACFAQTGCIYKRYNFIADGFQNSRAIYRGGFGFSEVPQEVAHYMPFGSSVISRYINPRFENGKMVADNLIDFASSPSQVDPAADNFKTFYSSHDPRIMPRHNRYGMGGFQQDASGYVYMNGEAYDTYHGVFERPKTQDSTICAGGPESFAHAQSLASFAMGMDPNSPEWEQESFSPSRDRKYEFSLKYLDWLENSAFGSASSLGERAVEYPFGNAAAYAWFRRNDATDVFANMMSAQGTSYFTPFASFAGMFCGNFADHLDGGATIDKVLSGAECLGFIAAGGYASGGRFAMSTLKMGQSASRLSRSVRIADRIDLGTGIAGLGAYSY